MTFDRAKALVALLLAATVLVPNASFAASVADLGVDVVSDPASVSPAGGIVLYRIEVTNDGPIIAPADVTDATSGGTYVASASQIPSECTEPADGTVDPVVTCSFGPIAPGTGVELAVAIRTPAAEGSVSNTATVAVPPSAVGVVDQNPANDTSSVTTPVVNDPNQSSALLKQGESLAFQNHVLTARATDKGVIASLSVAPASGTCGTSPCGEGLSVGFSTDPRYQGDMGLLVDFGKGNPCRGIGSGARCADLYVKKDGVATLLQSCGIGVPLPCVESVAKSKPNLQWTIRLRSEDPEFVPPLSTSAT
ncbi:MAG TPA: hypothetical protein VM600_09125 [Actinomycetota bacterium]|nr:hypothetical protein [Actinomycetota bacterium]